ncbi:MAG: hypothetical protein KTR18_16045 [Acidiferrobacterales bacterium]|nr:hypothetical protein [Acidiferrobacterales bacterium]
MYIQPQFRSPGWQEVNKGDALNAAQNVYRLLDDIVASKTFLSSSFSSLARAIASEELHTIQGRFILYRTALKNHLKLVSVGMYLNLEQFKYEKTDTAFLHLEKGAYELNRNVSKFLAKYQSVDDVSCQFFESAVYEIDFQVSTHYERERRALHACCHDLLNTDVGENSDALSFAQAG